MEDLGVPGVVANEARALGAEAWLAALPSLVRDLEQEWGLTAGEMLQAADVVAVG